MTRGEKTGPAAPGSGRLLVRWTTCRLVLVEADGPVHGRRQVVAEGSVLPVARWTAAVEAAWQVRADGSRGSAHADRLVLPLGDPKRRSDGTWDPGWVVTAAYLRTLRALGVPPGVLWRAVVEASAALLAAWCIEAARPAASVDVVGGRVTRDPRFADAFRRTGLTAVSP